jgi:DNA-binding CsgD family transcriptional regulator
MGARQAMECMLENSPLRRVIIVTIHDDPRLVRELIGLGASAYLVKSATIEELLAAVHTAARRPAGNVIIPPKTLRNPAEGDDLSRRELEVLLMVARGMSNHQIAISLHLSEATIKRHLANIYPKIGVSSRREADPGRGRREGPGRRAGGRADRGPVLEPGPLGLRHGLGRRARALGFGRVLGAHGHPSPPRAGVRGGAGRPTRLERLGPRLQIRRKSNRHGPPASHRLRRSHRARLCLPRPEPDPLEPFAYRGGSRTVLKQLAKRL